jgi:hypothetical protein
MRADEPDAGSKAARPLQVLLASPRSFCAGVERAIEIVELALERYGPPVYVRKQIVHNTSVVAMLKQRGAVFVDELDEVPDGGTVVFSAHGVSPQVRGEARRRGPGLDRASRDDRRCRQATARRPWQGRVPDADHAGRRRSGRDSGRDQGSVPRG